MNEESLPYEHDDHAAAWRLFIEQGKKAAAQRLRNWRGLCAEYAAMAWVAWLDQNPQAKARWTA